MRVEAVMLSYNELPDGMTLADLDAFVQAEILGRPADRANDLQAAADLLERWTGWAVDWDQLGGTLVLAVGFPVDSPGRLYLVGHGPHDRAMSGRR